MNYKKILKRTFKTIGAIVLFFVLYFLSALGLAYIPSNPDFKSCEKDAVEIFIQTNGVHTDIVMPLQNDIKNWAAFVNPANTKSAGTHYKYVAFGWGDKGFYLQTPTWGELKFKTAFNAMFFLSTTAMHVTFHQKMEQNQYCKKICITTESYKKLIDYVENSFATSNPLPIAGASYGNNDLFYDAKGTYSMFYTCNTWINSGLKSAGLKACLWTLFDKGIFDKYP